MGPRTATQHSKAKTAFIALCTLLISMLLLCASPLEKACAASNVEYITILGLDTWKEKDGSPHYPACDLMMLARVDADAGTVSLLSIPRELKYDRITKWVPYATAYKPHLVFRSLFAERINGSWDPVSNPSNYEATLRYCSEKTCEVVEDITGNTDYYNYSLSKK